MLLSACLYFRRKNELSAKQREKFAPATILFWAALHRQEFTNYVHVHASLRQRSTVDSTNYPHKKSIAN
jgi:hypothetical protein